jgi:limonene 1,2-monooxygenase
MTPAPDRRLRFGGFMAPFHLPGQSPTVLLEHDLEIAERLDRLGFAELWVGEHHSSGVETVTSPELFLTAASQRTKNIRLATGVISLPYHQPLMVADRIALLDQLSHGRAILGLGPGQLASDAYMLGIDPSRQRDMLGEGAGAVQRLLRGEVVTEEADWFRLREARVQIRPLNPDLEIVAAAAVSPSGPRVAGRYGLGMINFAAASPAGFDALRDHWSIAEQEAERHGRSVTRSGWRLMCNMHIAQTMDEAIRDVERGGFRQIWDYLASIATAPPVSAKSTAEWVSKVNDLGAIIGTPADAIEKIRQLDEQSGGFGCFVMGIGDFAPFESTLRSIDLFANYVIPEFNGQLDSIRESNKWVMGRKSQRGDGGTVWRDVTLEAIEKAAVAYEAIDPRRNPTEHGTADE